MSASKSSKAKAKKAARREHTTKWFNQLITDLRILAPVGLSFVLLITVVVVAWLLNLLINFRSPHFSIPMEIGFLVGILVGAIFGPSIARWEKEETDVHREDSQHYLDGKMKRYSLLFAVNGGAFAIAKLLDGPTPPRGLTLAGLSVGAMVFTVIMTADIWLWGAAMRNQHGARIFRPVGQTILLMIGALLCSGWALIWLNRAA